MLGSPVGRIWETRRGSGGGGAARGKQCLGRSPFQGDRIRVQVGSVGMFPVLPAVLHRRLRRQGIHGVGRGCAAAQ